LNCSLTLLSAAVLPAAEVELDGAVKEAMDEVDDEAATEEKEDSADEVEGREKADDENDHIGVDAAAVLPSAAAVAAALVDAPPPPNALPKFHPPPPPLPNFGAPPAEPKLRPAPGKEKPADVMAPVLSFLVSAAVVADGLGVSQAAHLECVFLLRVSHVGHSQVSELRLAASWEKLVMGAGAGVGVVEAAAEESVAGAVAAAGVEAAVSAAAGADLSAAASAAVAAVPVKPSVVAAGVPKKLNAGNAGCTQDTEANKLSVSVTGTQQANTHTESARLSVRVVDRTDAAGSWYAVVAHLSSGSHDHSLLQLRLIGSPPWPCVLLLLHVVLPGLHIVLRQLMVCTALGHDE